MTRRQTPYVPAETDATHLAFRPCGSSTSRWSATSTACGPALRDDGRDGGAGRARGRADRALGGRPLPRHPLPRARPGGARGGHGDRVLHAPHGRAARARPRGHPGARPRARRPGARVPRRAPAWPTGWSSWRATRWRRSRPLEGPFDLLFVDASKGEYARYIELAEPLLSERALLVVDNLLMSGEVALPEGAATPVGRGLAGRRPRAQPGADHRVALARKRAAGGRRPGLRGAGVGVVASCGRACRGIRRRRSCRLPDPEERHTGQASDGAKLSPGEPRIGPPRTPRLPRHVPARSG